MSDPNGKLTGRQAAFVREYLASDGNAADAYARAYGTKNLNSAAACGSRLLKIAKVAAAVEAGRKAVTDAVVEQAAVRNLITVAEVVLGLRKEAHFEGRGSSHSARVSAWSRLAALLGLDRQPDRDDHPHVHTVTIVLTVPAEERPS